MIENWGSYALGDFLMFSPASYFRRYELANSELWPGQLLLIALAAALLWAMLRPGPRLVRAIAPMLAAAWLLVALLFLHRHYAQINLAAEALTWAFLLQAFLLIACGLSPGLRRRVFKPLLGRYPNPGVLLALYAILIHPLVGLLAGRSWRGVELFGLAPDATALATIGVLLASRSVASWPLLLIPLGWCGFSALTYLAMGLPYGALPILLALLALAATIVLSRIEIKAPMTDNSG